jgi:hypothetical protein
MPLLSKLCSSRVLVLCELGRCVLLLKSGNDSLFPVPWKTLNGYNFLVSYDNPRLTNTQFMNFSQN